VLALAQRTTYLDPASQLAVYATTHDLDPLSKAAVEHYLADVLAGADQISERHFGQRRDPRERQLPGDQQSRLPDRVTLVGLDPIRRSFRYQPGCHHPQINPRVARRAASPNPVGPTS
jgi:hypothetical protein